MMPTSFITSSIEVVGFETASSPTAFDSIVNEVPHRSRRCPP